MEPPVAAPAPRPVAPSVGANQPSSPAQPVQPVQPTAEQRQFIDRIGSIARRSRAEIGLPPSLVVAMAINETGWGKSVLAQQANSFFGIKALRGPGTAGVLEVDTWEFVDGEPVSMRQPFRAYRSVEESVRDLPPEVPDEAGEIDQRRGGE